jgi:hypothetical protein
MMKAQEVRIYREIQKNTEMALKAIDTISDKVHDHELAMQINEQALKYAQIHNEAVENLLACKAEPYRTNKVEEMVLKSGIRYNTMLNTSTGHIAEMMIKGNNNGIVEMKKILNHNENADGETRKLAEQLIDFEQKSIDSLIKYL